MKVEVVADSLAYRGRANISDPAGLPRLCDPEPAWHQCSVGNHSTMPSGVTTHSSYSIPWKYLRGHHRCYVHKVFTKNSELKTLFCKQSPNRMSIFSSNHC